MFSAFTNSLKIPELRSRIFYTLSLLFVARVGAHIPLPGIDPAPSAKILCRAGGRHRWALVGHLQYVYRRRLGKRCRIAALGIMPYISASIIFQLMTAVVPALSRLAAGR